MKKICGEDVPKVVLNLKKTADYDQVHWKNFLKK